MLAQKNPDIDLAINSMYMLYQDDNIREQMIAREEYYAHENYMKKTIEDQDKTIKDMDKIIEDKDKTIKDQEARIAKLEALLAAKD